MSGARPLPAGPAPSAHRGHAKVPVMLCALPQQPATDDGERHDDTAAGGPIAEHGLLDAIIRQLPVGLTVQDERGNVLLVNDTAAGHFGRTAPALPAAAAADAPLAPTLPATAVTEAHGDRVLLTTRQPLRVADRTLMLSTSIDVTSQKATEDELSRRAYFDELTGLPKRTLIESHVNALLADADPDKQFALVFFDIDNFKHINDYYGHAVGDTLLVKIAKRLSGELRASDMLARISGDEFLLMLNPVRSGIELVTTVDRLIQRLKAPMLIDDFEIFASASVGASLHPDHGTTYDVLRHHADIAMYSVKSATKGGFAVFDSSMAREACARTELEQNLRLAILEKRFHCAFQPKVDIRSQEVIGVEALVRLYNEKGVMQAPGTFIDLAVELGLIDELTHLVLDEVMDSIDLIDAYFGHGVSISINVAAKQANDPLFMRAFAAALAATNCPERFMIEVTEEAFVRTTEFQTDILPGLREIGVGVSIDDFGTGYSSLSALTDITADEIKIDRSFVTDIHKRPRSQAVLRAIESLSEALGMTVIAEGVESYEELAYLQGATRIRYAQGYYFSRPVTFEDMQASSRTADLGRGLPDSRLPRDHRFRQSRPIRRER